MAYHHGPCQTVPKYLKWPQSVWFPFADKPIYQCGDGSRPIIMFGGITIHKPAVLLVAIRAPGLWPTMAMFESHMFNTSLQVLCSVDSATAEYDIKAGKPSLSCRNAEGAWGEFTSTTWFWPRNGGDKTHNNMLYTWVYITWLGMILHKSWSGFSMIYIIDVLNGGGITGQSNMANPDYQKFWTKQSHQFHSSTRIITNHKLLHDCFNATYFTNYDVIW